jgi:hypothetical protein
MLVAAALGVPPAAAGERGTAKPDAAREFTLGVAQKELRQGMSQADVAEWLGSPNIVTREPDGREAWIYDRVSSEVEASSGSVGIGGVGSGASGSLAGVLGISAGKRAQKARSSQRTLTVVVRFTTTGAVAGFSWHASRF